MRHILLPLLVGLVAPDGLGQESQKKQVPLEREVDPKRAAEERAVRELAAGLVDAGRVDAATMRAYHAAPVEVRRGLFAMPADDHPLSGEMLVELAGYVLANEAEETVRTHAVGRLGRGDLKETVAAGKVLVKALADKAPGVRSFACQSLWQHGDKALAPEVRPRLKDDDREVRWAAVRTLGMLKDVKSVPDIVKVYEADAPGASSAWVFAESLAALGEAEVSVAAALQSMASDNWNVRYFAVQAVGDLKAEAAVPALVECLRRELPRVVAGEKMTGFDERIFKSACERLAKHTGETHGLDPVAWADWWATARKRYNGAEWKLNREDAARAFAEYQKRQK